MLAWSKPWRNSGREARRIARPFIPWIGGKEKLAPYIRQVLPPGPKTYVEPFGGSGAILLGLPPSSRRLDIYNDYNRDLVNLFLCTKHHVLELSRELRFLQNHSRAQFEFYKAVLRRDENLADYCEKAIESEMEVARDEHCFSPGETKEVLEILQGRAELASVQRAAAYFYMAHGSYDGNTTHFGPKACNIASFIYLLNDASVRLQDVVIENMDGAELVSARNHPDALFYCDPPYYEAEKVYEMLFPEEGHIQFHKAVSQCKGFVVVSYNDCQFIRELYQDFYILAFSRNNSMAKTKDALYHELLLTNFDPRGIIPQMNLFELSGQWGDMELVHIPDTSLKKY